MKKTKWGLLLVLTLVLSMFLVACGGDTNETTEDPAEENAGEGTKEEPKEEPKEEVAQVVNILESAEIPTMDTVLGTDTVAFNVANQVFEGLYRLDENNQPTEGIAIDHTVSADNTVYTFNLRDAQWSNGTPVTANDFVFAWRRAVDPETGSEYGPYMMNGVVKNAEAISSGELAKEELGIKAIDDKTLEVTLERPVPYFESLMTFPTFFPQNEEFVTSQGDNYALEADTLIYNGPFNLSEWKHEEGWVMTKSDTYWDKDVVKLDSINVKVVKDPATAVNLYETGKVDRAGLSSEFVDKYRSHPDFTSYGEPVVFWLKYNQTKNPALANVNVRKAISKAIDKQGLTDVILNNGSIPAYFAVPQDFVTHPETGEDFRAGNGDLLPYDVAAAKEFWTTALSELGTDSVTVQILGGDTETSVKMQEYFKNQLETNLPGLKVDLLNVPFKQRLELDTAMDYDIQFAGWGPDYLDAMTFADLWVTDGGNNKTGYSNPEYDELINAAKTELIGDPAARFEAMQKAEKILLEEDAAIGPLYQRGVSRLAQPYLKNVYKHSFGPDNTFKWAYIEK